MNGNEQNEPCFETLGRGAAHRQDKKVFVLRGSSPAANFLALPNPGPVGLGLTGAYLYLQVSLVPGEAFTMHFDLLTDAGLATRPSPGQPSEPRDRSAMPP